MNVPGTSNIINALKNVYWHIFSTKRLDMSLTTTALAGVAAETATTQVSSSLVDILIKPKIEAYAKKKNLDKQVFEHSVYGKFNDYFQRAYAQHSNLTTLSLRSRSKLKELYVPLTLISHKNRPEKVQEILVDCYPEQLIPAYQKVLLIDDAGMGKSTLLKYLFLSYVDEIGHNNRIPVLIELRRLKGDKQLN